APYLHLHSQHEHGGTQAVSREPACYRRRHQCCDCGSGKGGPVVAEVETVAVIGAGIMGRGIAHAAAIGGYRTILEDLLPGALRRAESEIRTNLDKAVEVGKVAALRPSWRRILLL